MLKTLQQAALSTECQSIQPLLVRCALRYYISGRERDALVEQTLTALLHDPDLVLQSPIEKAVALIMHRMFLSNTALKPRQKSKSILPASDAEPVVRL